MLFKTRRHTFRKRKQILARFDHLEDRTLLALSWNSTNLGLFGTDIGANVTPNGSFFASDGFDIEKSTNQGATWTTVTGFAAFAGGAITYAPSDPSTMMAGTDYGTLKSADGGSDWFEEVQLNAGPPPNAIAFQPNSELTVYAGFGYGWGLYKSTNGGATWTNPVPSKAVSSIAIDPVDPNNVYVGLETYSFYTGGLMETTDGGSTWTTSLSNQNVSSILVDPANTRQIYAGTTAGTIFKSQDGGTTWSQVSGSTIVAPISALAFDPQNSEHLWAATSGQGVFYSPDGGTTWTADNQGLTDLNVVAMSIQTAAPYDVFAATYDGKGFWATVAPASIATPTFTGLTPSQSIVFSTPSVTVGGTLKAGSVAATGNVSITLDNVTQTAAIQADGSFSSVFNTAALAVTGSPYGVTYDYAATANFNAASDSSTAVTVDMDTSKTSVTSSASTSEFGQPVMFTVVVAASSPGVGNPTGTVTFKDGSTTLGTGTLNTVGGVTTASFTTASLAAGTHAITASYGGDRNFTGSAASTSLSVLVSSYVVTNTSDSGTGSLRQVILNVNAASGVQTIDFDIPGSGVHTISPASALPTITVPVILDGTSQPGFVVGRPVIELNGSLAGSGARGLDISAGGSTVRGLVINRFGESGIYLESGNGNTIQGNFIGTDPTGTVAEGNGTGAVLSVNDAITIEGSSNNTIGGTTVAARNIISGNHVDGVLVFVGSANNVIEGNFVGTDVTGTKALPNAYSGVRVDSTSDNTIGGTAPGAGNVISSNGQFGIFVVNSSPGTVIEGNLIGTDISGTQPLGNVGDGILLATSATDETVGGTAAGAGNTIAFNGGNGVTIGDNTSDASTGDAVLGNSIFSNTGLGIDLGDNTGVTLNNSLGHSGPNNYQNFPVLTSVTAGTGSTTIAGSLSSTANTNYTIQFFANAAADPSGYGEGQTYLGQTSVTTNGSGNASFSAIVNVAPNGQAIFSATATDPAGNTSEFSKDISVQSSGSAIFLKQDATTKGSWSGTYGAQGYDIVSGPTSLPSGDTVTPSRQLTYTYTTTSSDPRALQVPGSSNRVAAVWYSATNFTVDVNLADGQTHNLELYFDDWDKLGRAEQVQISDAGTGKVLDTETISSFSNGLYLDWKVAGNLVITITRQAGANAVLNGVFLDSLAPPPPPASTASFLKPDATTKGSWSGIYGAQGYDIVSGPTSLPSGDTVTPSRQLTYTYTTTSSDPRALQVPGSSNRVAAVWYSATNFTVDVNLADGQTHNLELYFDDWDKLGRAEQVQISDAGTGKVLDTETISSFSNGLYLDWKVSGNLVITITRQAGANAVLNGVFLDATSSPPPSATASFLKLDATTKGSWSGTYGAQGYDIVSGPTSLPSGDTVTPSGQTTYTLTTTSSDSRALQVPGSSNRVAAVWYSATNFTVDVNLADGQTHNLETLYFVDWSNSGRAEEVQISDAGTGKVLDTETISSFSSGLYLDWKVAGNLVITITRQAGANAVLNGVFLDGAQSSAALYQLGAGASVNTERSSNPSTAGAAIARGSSGGLAIAPAAGPVDAVLGALPDDDDAAAPAAGSSIHDLAMEQVSEPSMAGLTSRRWRL